MWVAAHGSTTRRERPFEGYAVVSIPARAAGALTLVVFLRQRLVGAVTAPQR